RQERRRRASQQDDEVEQVAEPFGPRQLLGTNQPEQQDHAARRAEGNDGQQVARATGREDVDEDERQRASDDRRQNQHRQDRDDGIEREQQPALEHHAVRRENRHDHQRHHPRRVQQRLAELREVETQPVHRRGHEQIEVLRQKGARDRRDDVGEHQDGDEGQQNEAKNFSGNQRAELFDRAQAAQDAKQHVEHEPPERATDQREQNELAAAAARALLANALQRRPPLGLEYVQQRRLLHRPRTSASSRTCAPPVSFRNSSSRLASPAWCWRRTSFTVPAAMILPCWMIAIWSHIASAISSVCVLISTVPPFSTNWRKMSLSSRAALGSSPTIGSSTTMHSGRWISALE